MPQKSWAVGEEVLAADFNTYVQQQVVPAFANVATRDSQWATPPNGALCVTTDTNTLWQRIQGAWAAGPSGGAELGYAENTATAFSTANTETDVPSLSVSVTLPTTRKVMIEAYANTIQTGPGTATYRIRHGGTTGGTGTLLTVSNQTFSAAGDWRTFVPKVRKSLAAGTYAFRCTMASAAAGVNLQLQGDPTYPVFLLVRDLGG